MAWPESWSASVICRAWYDACRSTHGLTRWACQQDILWFNISMSHPFAVHHSQCPLQEHTFGLGLCSVTPFNKTSMTYVQQLLAFTQTRRPLQRCRHASAASACTLQTARRQRILMQFRAICTKGHPMPAAGRLKRQHHKDIAMNLGRIMQS